MFNFVVVTDAQSLFYPVFVAPPALLAVIGGLIAAQRVELVQPRAAAMTPSVFRPFALSALVTSERAVAECAPSAFKETAMCARWMERGLHVFPRKLL